VCLSSVKVCSKPEQTTPVCVFAVPHTLGRRWLCRSRCKLQPPPPRSSLIDCRVSNTLGVSSWGRGMRLPPSIALSVPCLALICCVGGRSLCLPPVFPFQRLRVMLVLRLQHHIQQASCLCFRFLSPCSPMSSNTFWSDACTYARNRPLPSLQVALHASHGATVRRPPLLPLGAFPAHFCIAGCLVCV
jgi:hypothetical protein